MSKNIIQDLINNKPNEFIKYLTKKLNEKRNIILNNKVDIFRNEVANNLGFKSLTEEPEDKLKTIYFEGKKAHEDGKKLEDNPYTKEDEKNAWGRGWSINNKQEDLKDDGKITES